MTEENAMKLAADAAGVEFDQMLAAMPDEEKAAVRKIADWFFRNYGKAGYKNLTRKFLSKYYDNKNFNN